MQKLLASALVALFILIPSVSFAESTTACTFTVDLRVGSRGADVTCLQDFLRSKGFFTYTGGSTGYFGEVTRAAVAAWQAAHNITPALGYFGAKSRAGHDALVRPGSSCPITSFTPIVCASGQELKPTYGANGCQSGWQCVSPTPPTPPTPPTGGTSCPITAFTPVPCASGQELKPTYGTNGCQNGWQCVPPTVTPPTTPPRVDGCAAFTTPEPSTSLCPSGWKPNIHSTTGCQIGWQCVTPPTVSPPRDLGGGGSTLGGSQTCPLVMFAPIVCPADKTLLPTYDLRGCQNGWKCSP